MIGMNGKRESGKSILAVWFDDDDDDWYIYLGSYMFVHIYICIYIKKVKLATLVKGD